MWEKRRKRGTHNFNRKEQQKLSASRAGPWEVRGRLALAAVLLLGQSPCLFCFVFLRGSCSGSRVDRPLGEQALGRFHSTGPVWGPDPPVTRHKLDGRSRPPPQRQLTLQHRLVPINLCRWPARLTGVPTEPRRLGGLQSPPCPQACWGAGQLVPPLSTCSATRNDPESHSQRDPKAGHDPASGRAWHWKGNLLKGGIKMTSLKGKQEFD